MKVSVDAEALRRILQALNGPPHLIRELQATRGALFNNNPIDVLVREYNVWAGNHEADQRPPE
jgi:hypothetical protein